MKKLIIIFVTNLVVPFLLLIILPSLFINSRGGVSQYDGNNQIPLTVTRPFSFHITADQPNLESIVLQLKNPNLANNSRIFVDITGPNDTRSLVLFGANVGDPSSVPLKFIPLTDPSGTLYQIQVSSENSDDQSLYIITSTENIPVFSTYYHYPSFWQNLNLEIHRQFNRISSFPPIYTFIYLSLILILDYFFLKCK